jgi:hypothetical protein
MSFHQNHSAMQKYMITITLPSYFSQEYIELIPRQRMKIMQMLNKGRLSSFSLNSNRSMAWMVMNAKDEADVQKQLAKFPMHRFFSYEVEELMVYDTEFMGLPKVVLN